MIPRPNECRGCPLDPIAQGFSEPEGTGANGVLMIGEALGESEAKDGLPFRPSAPAGSILERAITWLGMDRQQFALWNVVACRPPNNKLDGEIYETAAIDHCRVHMDSIVDRYRPRAILALGGTATRTLTSLTGRYLDISHLRGYVLPVTRYPTIPVIGSFHPSFIRRGSMSAMPILMHDISKATEVAAGRVKLEGIATREYHTQPDDADIAAFKEATQDPSIPIACDIETVKTAYSPEDERKITLDRPTLVQFSYKKGYGIAFPYVEPFVSGIIKTTLASANPKVWHYGYNFDIPILEREGFVINGVQHDTMYMWLRCQPDLKADLQFVASFCGFPFPWKHMALKDLALYGCADVDATMYIYESLSADLKRRGIEGSYRHVYESYPYLAAMCRRGLPYSEERKQVLGATLEHRKRLISSEVQARVPPSLLQYKPSQGYVKVPKPVVTATDAWNNMELPGMETSRGTLDDYVAKTTGLIQLESGRWARPLGFNLGSPSQVAAYAAWKKYPISIHPKTKRPTTNETALARLIAKHPTDPVLKAVLDYREVDKMKGTYHDNMVPGLDGRIHPNITFRPATGQLSTSGGFPALTIYRGGDGDSLADSLRACFVARPGYSLVNFDRKSFHAKTMGFEARDAAYMRLADLDVHSYVTAHMVKFPGYQDCIGWSDADLGEYLAEVKRHHSDVRKNKAKQALLGIQFGEGPRKLHLLYPEHFKTEREARKIIDLILNDLFPSVKSWQDATRRRASQQRYLLSRYGYIRWFWEVFTFSRSPLGDLIERPGENYNDCIAFEPANDAHGWMRDDLIALGRSGALEEFGFWLMVHDSFAFEVDDSKVDVCVDTVNSIIDRPNPVLVNDVAPDGLYVKLEVSVGKDYGCMTEVH